MNDFCIPGHDCGKGGRRKNRRLLVLLERHGVVRGSVRGEGDLERRLLQSLILAPDQLEAVRALDLDVPQELSIVGFNDSATLGWWGSGVTSSIDLIVMLTVPASMRVRSSRSSTR